MTVSLPLAGRRILVTRAKHQAGKLALKLRELGAEVIELPLIEIVPPNSYEPLDEALRNAQRYQWLIVTSANTARVMAERVPIVGMGLAALSHLKVVAVGSATAATLTDSGIHISVMPEKYVAESVTEAISEEVRGQRVLLARAAVARDVIPDALRACGAIVDVVEAYKNIVPAESVAQIRKVLQNSVTLPDAVTFTSSSTVTNFFQLMRETGIDKVPDNMLALSIGPVTSATLRQNGWEPAAEAEQYDLDGLIAAAVRVLGR